MQKDGRYSFDVGQSTLKVIRLGRVTFTEFNSGVSGRSWGAHYFDAAANLKHSISAIHSLCHDSGMAIQQLRATCLGEALPSVWNCRFGADADALQTWVGKWGYTALGESGMRAKAMHDADRYAVESLRERRNALESALDALRRAESADYPEARERLRKHSISTLARIDAEAQPFHHARTLSEFARANPALVRWNPRVSVAAGPNLCVDSMTMHRLGLQFEAPSPEPVFYARPDTWSHEYLQSNYIVSQTVDGRFRLSSSIEVPFTQAQARAWLRGEADAPTTRYGCPIVLDLRDAKGNPCRLIKCGCHLIDAARDLGGEWAELLKPPHTVSRVAGAPRVEYAADSAAFWDRWDTECARNLNESKRERERVIRDTLARRADLESQEANQPAFIASIEARIASIRADITAAEEKQEAIKPMGADLVRAESVVRALLTALTVGNVVALKGVK